MTNFERLSKLPTHGRAAGRATLAVLSRSSTSRGAAVLAYHDVLSDDAPHFEYAVSLGRFRQHLDVVSRLGLSVVSLQEISQRLLDGTDLTGLVAIVFDDALVGVHHLALPELAARGWRATLLPVVDQMGTDPPWWPGSQRTMTWPELIEAVHNGIDLAAHGTSHACLPCLADQPLTAELHASRGRLTDLLGVEVDQLAYPYGHHDERVRDAVRSAGYTTAYTFLNGRVSSGVPPLRLPRLTMHQRLSAPRLAHQLSRVATDWPRTDQPVVHPH